MTEGLHGREGGSHSLGCASCGERESQWIGIFVGVEFRFLSIECGEWTHTRAKTPCRHITST